jgi:hypothetical protein
MKKSPVLVVIVALLLTPARGAGRQNQLGTVPQPQQQKEKIIKILSDPVLWRKDFPSLLATLKNWNIAGESKVTVFSNQASGARKFDLAGFEALSEAAELHSLMVEKRPDLRPDVEASLTNNFHASLTTLSPVAKPSQHESKSLVTLDTRTIAPPELVASGLTLAVVRQQSGEPESISTQVIDSGDERRPIILTLYHYAGDSIVFAVSDMDPIPDVIERVILDTSKVSEALFVNGTRR